MAIFPLGPFQAYPFEFLLKGYRLSIGDSPSAYGHGIGGLLVQATLIFVCLCMAELLYLNVTALAMAPFDSGAGSASALLGTIQYTLGR